MWAKLLITDGTKDGTIDLLPYYKEWLPQLPSAKDGGYWSGSPYTQGRQLFDKQFDNILDTFVLTFHTRKQFDTIDLFSRLTTLLDKGVAYWTNDFQSEMVWIEMRPAQQDESQYAIIHDWSIPELDEIFVSPFSNAGILDDISLIIEHGIWTENPPGVGTPVELQSWRIFGTTVGPSTSRKTIWINNYFKNSQITHVYVYDASVPSFSANLVFDDIATLFPAVPAVGDILYIGRRDVAGSSAFDNLIFDIGTPSTDIVGWEYEFWNGAAWTTFLAAGYRIFSSYGTGFALPGMTSIAFDPPWLVPDIWTPVAVNGVTAYWFRIRLTVLDPNPTPPITAKRTYTNERAYFDIPNGQIEGTYRALMKYELWRFDDGEIDKDIVPPATKDALVTKIITGLRSLSRGEDFSAYLPAYSGQQPTGVSFTILSAGAINVAVRNIPWGNYVQSNPAVGPMVVEPICRWRIAEAYSNQYTGSFRLFLRCKEGFAGTPITQNRIAIYQETSLLYKTDWMFNFVERDSIIDYGIITIPKNKEFSEYLRYIDFVVEARLVIPGISIYNYYDMILMPVDEHLVEYRTVPQSGAISNNTLGLMDQLIIDSITEPKNTVNAGITSMTNLEVPTNFYSNWQAIAPSEIFANPNVGTQRLWHLAIYDENYNGDGNQVNRAIFHPLFSVKAERNQRYKSLRGDR